MTTLMYVGAAIAGGLGMYWGIGGAFELIYYRLRRDRPETWKCQPRRWLSPRMQRQQILIGTANMTAGSIASGLFCAHVAHGGLTSIYLDLGAHGLPYAAVATLVYFLLTDCALYWAHRIFHTPSLFRAIHRHHHHRYIAPSAFTAAAMHPVEFATYQSVMLLPLFFFIPLPAAGVILVLVYQNYVALLDHSGVDTYSWFPWQPPTRFHDDHHVHFHVNYGQNLGVWDRIFGTHRREGRVYGVEVFGGKGAPAPGARGDTSVTAAPYVDYGRRPPIAAPPPSPAPSPMGASPQNPRSGLIAAVEPLDPAS